jgi:hypothetical protein
MLDLTAEQRTALAGGEPVACILDHWECVVMRKDIFDRMRRVAYDDSELSQVEMIALAKRAFDDADTAGPIP